jgi:predicted nuclease with RNAse H fold
MNGDGLRRVLCFHPSDGILKHGPPETKEVPPFLHRACGELSDTSSCLEMIGMKPIVVLGIDLAGSPKRPTGICRMEGLTAVTRVVFSDEQIRSSVSPDVQLVAIDAPLSLPRGRCCLRPECDCAGKAHFRKCDLELREMGIKFFPLTLGPMRMLTERGMRLKQRLEETGYHVVETFPGGAQDILGMPRQKNPIGLRRALKRCGVTGDVTKRAISTHELDAVTCALAARCCIRGRFLAAGDPDEGQIILPRPKQRARKRTAR